MKNAILELELNNLLSNNKIKIYEKSSETKIDEDILYYRNISEGLFYLAHYNNNVKLELTYNFKTFGTMIDLSRGAVFKVNYIKNLIRKKP